MNTHEHVKDAKDRELRKQLQELRRKINQLEENMDRSLSSDEPDDHIAIKSEN